MRIIPAMEAGLLALAARIPPFFLSSETVDRAYGRPPGRGGRRGSAYDEDALTLAAEAAQRCLAAAGRPEVRALYVASTTWPRSAAAHADRLAALLDLPDNVEVAMFGGSWRGGASALRVALATPRWPALVVAADRLDAPPGSDRETSVGDGAASVLVGTGDGVARIASWISRCDTTDWSSEDARFLCTRAEALASSAKSDRCSRAAISAPSRRAAVAAAKVLGLPAVDGAMEQVGFCGAAHPLLALIEAVESGRPGDRVKWVAIGDGLEAAELEIVRPPGPATFAPALDRRQAVTEYGRWLASRTWVPPASFASPAMEHRDEEFLLRLHGRRCASCDTVHTLPSPACAGGRPVALARTGSIFTFTHEHYVPSPAPPVTMAVVDLDGGGRLLVQMADAAPEEVRVGARVRLVSRRLHLGGGVPNYYWKAVPE